MYVRMQYEANPFFDESEVSVEPASAAYRYRKFTLGSVRLAYCTCSYVCMYACMYTCTFLNLYLCIEVFVFIYVCM